MEQALQFIGIEVGQRVFCLDLADAPFAAIAGMERLAVGKPLGANQALVAARFAAVAAALRRESFKRRGSDQRTLIAGYSPVAGNQGRAERSHQSGDIRPDHRTTQNLFGGSQYRIVVKRSALHYYGVAEFGGVFQADYFEQRIFYDGNRDACRDVADGSTFFLRLLDFGVHKDGAAGAQIDRLFCLQAELGKVGDVHAQGMGKGFDEGSATGRAGFVENDGINHAVFDAEAFHVLAADVQHRGDGRGKVPGCLQVRQCFDFAVVYIQRGLDVVLPVTGDRRAGNAYLVRQLCIQLFQGGDDGFERIALVAAVVGIQQTALTVGQRQFRGG